jgi:hypothetical protein
MKVHGIAIVWGIHEPRPITNLPDGVTKVRLRLRAEDAASATLRTAAGVHRYSLKWGGDDTWELHREIGCNLACQPDQQSENPAFGKSMGRPKTGKESFFVKNTVLGPPRAVFLPSAQRFQNPPTPSSFWVAILRFVLWRVVAAVKNQNALKPILRIR